MKTVADFPAFEVIDLELDVIHLPYEAIKAFQFCVSKETVRHGTLYPGVSPYCVAYYAMDYDEDPTEGEARALANKHDLYWINNDATVISDRQSPKGVRYLLKDGQKIQMNGVMLEVYRKSPHSDHYGLRQI